jgi:hypothetical protein
MKKFKDIFLNEGSKNFNSGMKLEDFEKGEVYLVIPDVSDKTYKDAYLTTFQGTRHGTDIFWMDIEEYDSYDVDFKEFMKTNDVVKYAGNRRDFTQKINNMKSFILMNFDTSEWK